jgi:hypothetical protein
VPDATLSRSAYLYVALAHVASRAAFYLAGGAFDIFTVETHWQFLDPRQLETNLGASILNLHAQPPLLNLLYGLFAKLSPSDGGAALAAAFFLLLGVATSVGIYHLAARLGAGRIAIVLAALYIANPASVLFESYFFYPHVVAASLCLAAVALDRYLTTDRVWWVAGFFASLTAVAMTRSSYHLVWLFLIALLAVALLPGRRTVVAVAGAVALVVAGGWYAKNLARFDTFTASSWMGMNLTRAISIGMSEEQVERLVQEGRVATIYRVVPFSSVDAYAPYVELPPPTGVPVLDEPRKASGVTNFNHLAYVAISKDYQASSLRLLAAEPTLLVESQPDAWALYFQPTSQYFRFVREVFRRGGFHGENLDALGGYTRAYDAVVGLQLAPAPSDEALLVYHRRETLTAKLASISWTAVLGTALAVFLIPAIAWRRERRVAIVLGFMWLTLVYTAVVSNLFEIGENPRFRFETEPLWLVLVGVAVMSLRHRLRRVPTPPDRYRDRL